MMNKKTEISPEDLNLFREAMRHVKPLHNTKVKMIPDPAPFRKKRQPALEENELTSPFSDYETLDPVGPDDIIEYKQPGIQDKILRKLRGGQYNIEATLDLHGMKVVEASESLHRFLLRCQQKGVRHALIVHGKGRNSAQPILKNRLNHWLRQTELVLAFCSATIKDGRGGSVYVLLKKGR